MQVVVRPFKCVKIIQQNKIFFLQMTESSWPDMKLIRRIEQMPVSNDPVFSQLALVVDRMQIEIFFCPLAGPGFQVVFT